MTTVPPAQLRVRSLWRLRSFVRPYAGHMITMTVAALIATLAGVVVPLVTRSVIDGPIARGDRGAVWPLGALALVFGLVEAFLIFLRRWMASISPIQAETDIRDAIYAKLQALPVAFHDRWQSGQLLSRASSDLSQLRRFLGFGLVFLIVNVSTFFIVCALLLVTYWPLGLTVLVLSAPLAWVMYRFEQQYRVLSRSVQDQQGELTTLVEESAGGIRTIKSYGRSRLMAERFGGEARSLRDLELGKVRLLAIIWAIIDVHPQVVLGVVVLIGSAAVAHGALTLGTLVAFVSLFLLLIWPIESLGWLLASAQEASTAAERIYEILDAEVTVADLPGATALSPTGPARVRFEQVAFGYPDSPRPVLDGIELDIAPGETVALVGATGSGKTTLAMLVPRLYDVTGGRITLDGADIRDLPLEDLRRHVAVAFEDPTLFSASVRENLTLGRPDASDEEVDEAIDVAQAGFVRDLPWGLDTRVGEQGLTLSGGQRQRLALARAVLGRPRVLVLDDPLSALDVHTEALVEEALRRVLATSTALVVAHRASTVALADRVALLVDGRIAALGTHTELMAASAAYRDLLSQEAELEVRS